MEKGRQNVVLVGQESKQPGERAKHRKANTQNLNGYHVAPSETRGRPADAYCTFDFERTYEQPSRVTKMLPRNKHELKLEQELKAYKAEVERRYDNSLVNKVFVYPRSHDDSNYERVSKADEAAALDPLTQQCKRRSE